MAAAEEVLTGIDTARNVNDTNASAVVSAGAGVEDTMAQTDAAKAKADELAEQLAGMGINDRAGVAGQVSAKLAEAQQTVATVKSQLDTAQSGLGRVKSLFDEAYVLAQSLGGLRAQAPGTTRLRPLAPPGSTSPGAVATPLDVPGKNHPRIQYQTGDQVTAPDGGPDDHHAELKGSDDGDKSKSRFRRMGRSMARNVGDLQDQAKASAEVRIDQFASFDPSGGQTSTAVRNDGPQIHSTSVGAPVQDVVQSAAILTAFMVEGVSRLMRNRRSKDK